jgi:hypothetical protein
MVHTHGFTYPAFFSYAHADSGASGGYVERFHRCFSDILAGKLGQRQLQLASPFLDRIDLPSVGSIDKLLDTKVKSSFALFLFVGRGYVNSQYCVEELKYFSHLFGGAQDELRDRVWILELEPLVGEVQERFKSRLREANTEKLWTNVRSRLYDARTRQRIFLQHQDGELTDAASALLGRFAEDLANRIEKATSAHAVSRVEFDQDVVIGAVTDDLLDASSELKAQLQAAGFNVDSLSENALTKLTSEDLKDRFARSRFAVLPVSAAKLLFPFIPGGHVKMQLDALRALPGTRHILWVPTDQPALGAGQREQNTRHREAWISAWNERQEKSVAEMATDIMRAFKRPVVADATKPDAIRVLIEMRHSDDSSWEFVGELLDAWWQSNFPEAAKKYRLEPEGLSLMRLFENELDILGDGVVVLRDPDDDMLRSKCDHVSRRMKPWKEKRVGIYPGLIAQLEPPDPGGPPLTRKWPIARFRLENGTLQYLEDRQDAKTTTSIERFLRRIEQWKNAGQSAV